MTAHMHRSAGTAKTNIGATHRNALAGSIAAPARSESRNQQLIGTAVEAYAQALLSAHESVSRYVDFADRIECRGNAEIAQLLRELSRSDYEHAALLSLQAPGSGPLPAQPALHSWFSDGPAERGAYEIVLHFMTTWSALNIALAAKARTRAHFEAMAAATTNSQARTLAMSVAQQAGEHARRLEAALQKAPRPIVSDEDMEQFLLH